MKISLEVVQDIIKHYFDKSPKNVRELLGGYANYVYEATVNDEVYIIRVSDDQTKLQYFLKEQWAVQKAREMKVPVPEILEVANVASSFPYMIVKKINGKRAEVADDRLKVLKEMGKYTATINSIPTSGYGHIFDWSSNQLSRNETWKDFLEKELKLSERLATFEDHKIFENGGLSALKSALSEIKDWTYKPTLNHGDMRLKNVIIDEKEKICGILDWEVCISGVAPYWDMSISLHDLGIDEKQAFIEGYGMTLTEFKKISRAIKAINIINYAYFMDIAYKEKEKDRIDAMKARLRGDFDLYSL